MQIALNTINVNEHDRLPNSTFRNKLEVKEQPFHCCSTLVYQTQEQKILPFHSISHWNCAWFYVIWNPEMAPDRTILHLVENNYGVHTIKPQLPYVLVYKSRLHERWINFLLWYIWMRWMFITNINKTLNTCSKHIKKNLTIYILNWIMLWLISLEWPIKKYSSKLW